MKGASSLGTGEIARLCRTTENTVKKWIDNGSLPGFRLPSTGHRRVFRESFIAFCTRCKIPVVLPPEENDSPEGIALGSRTMPESVANLKAFCNGLECDTRTLRSDCLAVLTSYETLVIGQRTEH